MAEVVASIDIAEVSMDTLQSDGAPGVYTSLTEEDQGISIFADYRIRSKYEKDNHKYMMGITSPGGFQGASVAFVQLASATLLWILDFTAARFNKPPNIPDPYSLDSNWVLLDEHFEPGMLTVGADGITLYYRISGTYILGHKNPNTNTYQNINFTRPPWLENVFTRTVPKSMFEKNLMDVGGGSVGDVTTRG